MAQMYTFIRWAGGKSWLVPFVENLTKDLRYNDYYEPFMGGASIFFALDGLQKSYLSDVNEELVNTFVAVRDNPKRIIMYLKQFRTDENSYYEIRESHPSGKYQRAARFIYLNAYSYNGLYRVNRKGKYNVPYGRRKIEINYQKIIEVSEKLRDSSILCQDFSQISESVKARDLVFLDPPYTVSKDTNCFIAYNAKLFSLEDQKRLASLIDRINKVGAYYILTNAAHETILDIFKDKGRMVSLERNSLIGGKQSYRGKVSEYIFTNIPEGSANDEQN